MRIPCPRHSLSPLSTVSWVERTRLLDCSELLPRRDWAVGQGSWGSSPGQKFGATKVMGKAGAEVG